ncbi:RNase H-like domain found in reverse transcriptase, partial [Phytophthora infestans]
AGGRKKNQVRHVLLRAVGWGESEDACLDRCKAALQNALQLAHPDPEKRLTVYTDASEEHWGAAITQIPRDQTTRPSSEQEHQPLMMLSGSFSGAAKRWAIVEKEAYAIVETCRRADYLLHRHDGFALFTDHRNLRFIFDPHSVSNSVPKYTADKLHRWSLLLMSYKYEIHDIADKDRHLRLCVLYGKSRCLSLRNSMPNSCGLPLGTSW